jgi:hypothetical protein
MLSGTRGFAREQHGGRQLATTAAGSLSPSPQQGTMMMRGLLSSSAIPMLTSVLVVGPARDRWGLARSAPPSAALLIIIRSLLHAARAFFTTRHQLAVEIGNEVYDNSNGQTTIRTLTYELNGQTYASVPAL